MVAKLLFRDQGVDPLFLVVIRSYLATFTLFAVLFFFVGAQFLAFGLLGEYIGRIYQQVRHRPRYLVEAVLEETASEKPKAKRAKKATKAA